MEWWWLLLAGFFEICFTTALKLSDNFSRLLPTVSFFIFMILSFLSLSKSIEVIPLGIAYAVWTGIGAAGTLAISILFFEEGISAWSFFFVVLLIFSIVGLKISH